ncbi:Ig domain-containing protein [Solirubrobacter soli]|uniref:Ig domain-containing protein n=1 Tax=Solirubrobacter soli TaxID=363832 RepID=UPI001B7FE220|nr:Ig domain-containing protein [Solirubrobacter soli]
MRLSVLVASLLALLAMPAVAAAAEPICTPAACTDLGKTRSVVLKRSGAKKAVAGIARVSKRTALRVSVKFAPKGAKPRVTVTGPRGFKRVISKSTSFRGARPGRYLISADPIPGTEVTTFATYRRTSAKLRRGINGWVGVRYMQQVQSTTRVAEPSAIETVSGDPNGVRDVVVDDPQALVQPGTVLAAGVGPQTPGGLLVAVDSVTRSGDKTIARGGPAPLTAIGPSAEIESKPQLSMSKEDFQKALEADSGGAAARSFKRTLPGFSLEGKPHAFAAAKKNKGFESPLECNTSATANFDGDVNFDAGTSVGIAWGGFWHPLTIQAHVGVKLHQDATMQVSIEGEAKCELELDLLPKDYRFTPWEFMVGPVPVVIVPKLNFQVTGEASVGAKISTYVEQSLDTEFGVQWDGSRFGPYGKASASFKTYKPTPSGNLNLKAAIGPKLMFDFYDVAGPYLTADLFLQLKADTAKDPWWRLSGGLQAGGGLRFKVWKFDFDKGIRDIWSEDWTIAKADKPPVPAFTTKTLPDADNGKAYSSKVVASSTRGPLTYTVNSGRLPEGLKLESDGRITGTAKGYGTTEFEVAAKDSLGQKGLRSFKVLTKTPPAVVKTTSLAGATVGAAYSATLEASGAVAPYKWAVTAGALPAGLRLDGDKLVGTPTALGSSAFTVKVRGVDGNEASRQLTLVVDPAPLAVATHSLATGKADTAYSQALTASGGRAPYTWAAANAPAGLTLAADGTLSGTPTVAFAGPLQVTVTDADGRTKSAEIAFTVADVDPVAITTTALPQAMSGVAYDQTLAAVGGRAPYTWSLIATSTDLTVTAGGHVSGTPSAAGSNEFVIVKVTDHDGRSATKTLPLEVLPPGISITTASLPSAQKDEAYDQALTALGGTAPYTWAVESGTLPAGLSLDTSTGHVSGTPTTVESQQVTFRVTSSDNATVTKTLTLAVVNLAAVPLDDVDCPTANFCLAVDRKAKAYTRTASTGWSAGVDMAGVPQSSMYQNRVSCASATYCIYLTNAGKAAKFDGTSWTRLPDLPGYVSGTSHSYWDIDCVSSTNCVVAGGSSDMSNRNGFVVKWDGSAWSGEIGTANNNGWTRIACPVANDCMVTGPGSWARFDGTTMSAMTSLAHGGRTLDCISMTECFTGSYADTSMKWNGTAWAASDPSSGGDTLRYSPIGCAPTGTFCAAGGDYGTGNAYMWTYDGSTWTKGPSTEMKTTEVSCGGPSLCAAVLLTGAARTWDGSSWTLSSVFARG